MMCLGLIEYVLISIKINAIGWYMSNYDRPRDSVHLAMSLAFSLSLAYRIQIDFWFFFLLNRKETKLANQITPDYSFYYIVPLFDVCQI